MKIIAYCLLLPLIATNTSKCSSKKDKKENSTTTATASDKKDTAKTTGTLTPVNSGEGAASMNNPNADSMLKAMKSGQTAADPAENYRVVISFASRGSGIDYTTQASFLKWVGEFTPHVNYEETHWGREGEVDYCLKLSELSTTDQERFVKEARTQLGNKDLIFIKENTPCSHKR
jgi:hypothetical protein